MQNGKLTFDPYYPYDLASGYSPYGYSPYGSSQYGYSPYGYSPYGSSSYGYSPYSYGNYSPYGYPSVSPYGYNPYGRGAYWPNYAYSAPVFMPAGMLFGTGPIMQQMGIADWFTDPPPRVAARPVVQPARQADNGDLADDAGPFRQKPRAAPPVPAGRAADLAGKYIGFGDTHFRNQKYSEAYERYRRAGQTAPQVADAWFRQGFALAAMGRYETAAKAIKRGLDVDPDWAQSEFHLSDLYGNDEMAKKAHLDAMAKAAQEDGHNGDLLFLLGVHLFFDGQADKAATFFQRASQIGGNDAALKGFLAQ
jgi:tetratricopeptide (TPR) repeat protein